MERILLIAAIVTLIIILAYNVGKHDGMYREAFLIKESCKHTSKFWVDNVVYTCEPELLK